MRVKILGSVIGTMAVLLISGSVSAAPVLGDDITVNDGIANNLWGTDSRTGILEDGETEAGTQSGQVWDLEMFDLNGASLTAIGGFDFINGEAGNAAGDIFISTPPSGTDPQTYNFVYDMDYALGTYDIYQIYDTTDLLDVTYKDPESNPYRLGDVTTADWMASGAFSFYSGLTDTEAGGMQGGDHYALTVDLMDLYAALYGMTKEEFRDFVSDGLFEASFAAHLTMECGNDTLAGAGEYYGGDPVPEPATMLLFGTGLIGLAAIGRKKGLKKEA